MTYYQYKFNGERKRQKQRRQFRHERNDGKVGEGFGGGVVYVSLQLDENEKNTLDHLIIQMKDTPENRQLIFIKVSEEKIGNNHIYVFTYENLVKGINIPEKSILEPENALTNTYHVSAGVYVLYHQKTSKVNICKIVIK